MSAVITGCSVVADFPFSFLFFFYPVWLTQPPDWRIQEGLPPWGSTVHWTFTEKPTHFVVLHTKIGLVFSLLLSYFASADTSRNWVVETEKLSKESLFVVITNNIVGYRASGILLPGVGSRYQLSHPFGLGRVFTQVRKRKKKRERLINFLHLFFVLFFCRMICLRHSAGSN